MALRSGSVVRSEQILATMGSGPAVRETLPRHLQVVLQVKRAFLATLAGDRERLMELRDLLADIGGVGETRLVAGLLADVSGDRHAAAAAFAEAGQSPCQSQPPIRAVALVAAAQLFDAMGDLARSRTCLQEALTITEVRKTPMPFVGWVRQGTPIAPLLDRHAQQSGSPWAIDLAELAAHRPDAVVAFSPVVASPRERAVDVEPTLTVALSPREREVLAELARGARYADIAAALYVSENTVKTHVSSLYSKLSVSRRSDALALARRMHLLRPSARRAGRRHWIGRLGGFGGRPFARRTWSMSSFTWSCST